MDTTDTKSSRKPVLWVLSSCVVQVAPSPFVDRIFLAIKYERHAANPDAHQSAAVLAGALRRYPDPKPTTLYETGTSLGLFEANFLGLRVDLSRRDRPLYPKSRACF
jgi:hypothetical protein